MANTYNYGIISGGTGSFGSIQFTSDEAGGTKEPLVLVKEFLGRKPNTKAFIKSLGVN